MVDRGLTHVALPVSNLNESIAFYTKYARMQVVHHRTVPTTGFEVAWLSDKTRPFVIVLSERSQVDHPLVPRSGFQVRLKPGVDMICIATVCAKRRSLWRKRCPNHQTF